jgi:hypothetical protein
MKPKNKPTVIEKDVNIKRVIVMKNNNYYVCKPTENGWKCGKCLFGLINPFAVKSRDDSCLRCGAKLHETITGSNYFNMESYQP